MKTNRKNRHRLSSAQISVLEQIYKNGIYRVKNSQNPTVKKLIELDICVFNDRYDGLIFTEMGKTFKP